MVWPEHGRFRCMSAGKVSSFHIVRINGRLYRRDTDYQARIMVRFVHVQDPKSVILYSKHTRVFVEEASISDIIKEVTCHIT